MRTVYKYPFATGGDIAEQHINVYGWATVRMVGLDPHGKPCIWAESSPKEELSKRTIYVVGTGQPIPEEAEYYLGSFVQGPYVWHVYSRNLSREG